MCRYRSFAVNTKHPVLTRPISNPQNPFSAPKFWSPGYADGLFVSASPLGPFAFEPYSPMSSKPSGFAAGAGHSSTFTSPFPSRGLYHIATSSISVRAMFERRLGIYPTLLTNERLLVDTYLGDYPHDLPSAAAACAVGGNTAAEVGAGSFSGKLPKWMLLTYNKPVSVSSTLSPNHTAALAVNEDIRTWWSAKTGGPTEWLSVQMAGSGSAPCHYASQPYRGNPGICHEGHTAAGQCNVTSGQPGTCASAGFTLCCETYGMGHNWIQSWFQMPKTCDDDGSRGPYATRQCGQNSAQPVAQTLPANIGAGGVTVHALQVNFADQDSTIVGNRPTPSDAYRWKVEYTRVTAATGAAAEWIAIPELDLSKNAADRPHHYVELSTPLANVGAMRITNLHMPGGAKFSLSGFRAFGVGAGTVPAPIGAGEVQVHRDSADQRHANVSWAPSARAEFYIVRFGLSGQETFHSVQIYPERQEEQEEKERGGQEQGRKRGCCVAEINSLVDGVAYEFVVDSVNAVGVTLGRGSTVA